MLSMQLIWLIQSIQTTQSIQLAQSIQNCKLSRSTNLPILFPNFCNFSKCSQSSKFGQSGQSSWLSQSRELQIQQVNKSSLKFSKNSKSYQHFPNFQFPIRYFNLFYNIQSFYNFYLSFLYYKSSYASPGLIFYSSFAKKWQQFHANLVSQNTRTRLDIQHTYCFFSLKMIPH